MDEVGGLTRFGRMARDHWEKHRPKLVARLKKDRLLHAALVNAQEQARTLIGELVSVKGVDLDSAREQALREFVLLPSEEEQPILEVDRMPYGQGEIAD